MTEPSENHNVGKGEAITFPDPNLEAAIREATGKTTGPIYPSDLTKLTRLKLYGKQISDISPLANLTSLGTLYLDNNQIRDISPLANLTNLEDLRLAKNPISDISFLANLPNLRWLDLA
jgi:Leucine-rich repeat (LRR) protein